MLVMIHTTAMLSSRSSTRRPVSCGRKCSTVSRTATSSLHVMCHGNSSSDQKPAAGAWWRARSTAPPQPRSDASQCS